MRIVPIHPAVIAAAFFLAFPSSVAAPAKTFPVPPCAPGVHAIPAYPGIDAPPNIETWLPTQLPAGWEAASCERWSAEQPFTLVALTGLLRAPGGVNELLARFGAVSTLPGSIYWSVTKDRLEPLIIDAYAVSGKSTEQRRPDFTPDEMRAGNDLFFVQHDNHSSGNVVYRMRVTEATPDRMVVEIDNVGSIRFLFVTLFAPGDLHSAFFLNRSAGDQWAYYSLSGAHEGSIAGLGDHLNSFVNRSIALYGHMARTADIADLPWSK
jgi:hypothetical protein